jgi:hypothetical protein
MLGRARFTEDVDAMFLLSIQDIPRLLKAAKEEGIEPRIENAAEFAKKSCVMLMRHVISDTNIDISLGIMPFEQEMAGEVFCIRLTRHCKSASPLPKTWSS